MLLHGLNSNPDAVEGLIALAREKGFPCATFRYPNDQPIEESATLLSRDLKKIAEQQPKRGVNRRRHREGRPFVGICALGPSLWSHARLCCYLTERVAFDLKQRRT
mgnify:CR=1 FL=1